MLDFHFIENEINNVLYWNKFIKEHNSVYLVASCIKSLFKFN